jgi:hypothetical protein
MSLPGFCIMGAGIIMLQQDDGLIDPLAEKGGLNQMNAKQQRLFRVIAAAAVLFVLILHRSIYLGLIAPYLPWNEDRFRGKRLVKLKNELAKAGVSLHEISPDYMYHREGRELQSNEYAKEFIKSPKYYWPPPVAIAINIGIVVYEKDTERILEIIRSRVFDSL